jgi:hypothetical protein
VIQRSDQKLGPFRTGTFVWSDKTSASPSGVSTSTPRKTASGNSSIILRVIQRLDQSYGAFETVLWSGATRPPPHLVAIPHLLQGKQRPETLLKFWRVIQRSDQKLWPFRMGTMVWNDKTSASTSSNSTSTPTKTCVRKLFYNFEGDPTVGSKVVALPNWYSDLARRHIRFTE